MQKNDTHSTRRISLLTGIGLVLVGLLTGILVMLFVLNARVVGEERPQVVERVELGGRPEAPTYRVPDSSIAPVLVDATALSRSFQEVARTVTPAVVFVRVDMGSSNSERGWLPRFSQPRQSVGSGVIISESGYIVTNNHVVEGAEEIVVTLFDKRQYRARVIGTDKATDLAVIKAVSAHDLPAAPLGDSDLVSVGEWVVAIGNPFRLTSTVTAGIVSALGRQVNIIDDRFGIEDFIQTDAAINPGNSGGALVNLQGELIGINTAIATESGSYEGYGFAVPVNLVERVVQDLISYGTVKRGYLGVTINPIDAGRAMDLGLERIAGVYLNDIFPGSAAEEAGLQTGDVVVSINGKAVNAPNELQRAVATHRPGDKLRLEVWRDRHMEVFFVELFGEEDSSYQSWVAALDEQTQPPLDLETEPAPGGRETETAFEIEDWGIGIKPVNDRIRRLYDVQHGVYVAFVRRGSAAASASLPRDVVLIEINGQTVYSLENALELFKKLEGQQETVVFGVKRRDGQTAFYEAEWPSSEQGPS